MSETTPLIKAALNLRVGAGFDVYVNSNSSLYAIKKASIPFEYLPPNIAFLLAIPISYVYFLSFSSSSHYAPTQPMRSRQISQSKK